MVPSISAALALLVGAAGVSCAFAADDLPQVASINLCADQHVLALADAEQILTVSWLAADAEESLFAAAATRYPLNHGTAEELLAFDPDVVIAGTLTSPFTRGLLRRLGYAVVELAPEESLADIEHNVRQVASAIGQTPRGAQIIRDMHTALRGHAAHRGTTPPTAVVVRPGGFTVGAHSLADELMTRAGVRNVAAEHGLDRWGSLSMEALVRSRPELVVLTGYRLAEPSLANAVLDHPALAQLERTRKTVTVPSALWSCGLPRSLDSIALLQRAAAP